MVSTKHQSILSDAAKRDETQRISCVGVTYGNRMNWSNFHLIPCVMKVMATDQLT